MACESDRRQGSRTTVQAGSKAFGDENTEPLIGRGGSAESYFGSDS